MTQPTNPLDKAMHIAQQAADGVLMRAQVTALDGTTKAFIKRLGATTADDQSWPVTSSVGGVAVGDDVIVAKIGEGLLILAKIGGSAASWSPNVVLQASTPYNAAKNDVVICTAVNISINMPLAATAGKGAVIVVKALVTTVTILRTGTDTIDGMTSISLGIQYESRTLISNGTNAWYVI